MADMQIRNGAPAYIDDAGQEKYSLPTTAGLPGQALVLDSDGTSITFGLGFGDTSQTWDGESMRSGVVVMWTGPTADIPRGWHICDGSNGTPDLRNRFVVGGGSLYDLADTGGSKDASVVSHSHGITDPGHIHAANSGQRGVGEGANPAVNTVQQHAGSENTSSSTTGISINSAGGSGTNKNMPPYMALYYIMYIG